ncbi:MAG TPA: FecR family protein [Syntrophorhabdaceae bacterium]|nr:FecR family protein [Syntrophorhabdaceae bacterium]
MKILSSLRYFFILFIVIQLALPLPIFAETIGKFADIRGDVTLEREKAKLKPNVNDNVKTKDFVTTGNLSRARLLLTDDSLLNIGHNSKVEITEYLLEKNKRQSIVSLRTGALHTKVEKFLDPDSKFEVRTPTAVAGARGTEWLTVVTDNPGTTIYAISQSVSVFNPAFPTQVVTVTAGNFTTVLAGAIPTVPVPFSAAALQGIMNQWNLVVFQPGAAAPGAATTGTTTTGTATTGAAGAAGTTAGTATAAGIGAGTVAAGVAGAAAIAAGIVAATGSTGTTTTHTTPAHH